MGEEIAEAFRIQAEVRPADGVVLAHKVSITDARHQPERLLHGNIKCLLPFEDHQYGHYCFLGTYLHLGSVVS